MKMNKNGSKETGGHNSSAVWRYWGLAGVMQKRTDVENTLSPSSFQNPGNGLEMGREDRNGWVALQGFWLEMSMVVPFTKTEKLREEQVGWGNKYFVLPMLRLRLLRTVYVSLGFEVEIRVRDIHLGGSLCCFKSSPMFQCIVTKGPGSGIFLYY